MLCRNPYATSDGKAYGCGQCMPCRSNRRRLWQSRILLEAALHKDNTFVTLTYNDQTLPTTAAGLGTVVPAHLRGFLDRLRYHFGAAGRRGVRFYGVGEYGDQSWRPHYHVALFNVPNCIYGQSRYSKLRDSCCGPCELVRSVWGKGNVYLGRLERDSAGYVASYVTKRMTKEDDPRLGGRYPEFSRKSLKPGIGAHAMFEVADTLILHGLDNCVDVPSELVNSRKALPLDRYLRRKLRLYIGREEGAPKEVLDEIETELSALRARASFLVGKERSVFKKEIFKALILDENDADFVRFEHRRQLFNRRRGVL